MKIFWLLLICSISFNSWAQLPTLSNFGANPGELTAQYYIPKQAPKSLVVLLHGCTQQAPIFAEKSGFLALAKQYNFALLLPQQLKKNNIKQCFNWYSPNDNQADQGEMLSLKNMTLSLQQQLANTQIFVVGFSAGGAMAAAMLANYPSLFKAGAIVGGIPFGCADGLIKAIACMRTGPSQSVAELVKAVTNNTHAQHWPKLLIYSGLQDKIVNPKNSQLLALQWRNLFSSQLQQFNAESTLMKIKTWGINQNHAVISLIELTNAPHAWIISANSSINEQSDNYIKIGGFSMTSDIINRWKLNK